MPLKAVRQCCGVQLLGLVHASAAVCLILLLLLLLLLLPVLSPGAAVSCCCCWCRSCGVGGHWGRTCGCGVRWEGSLSTAHHSCASHSRAC